MTIGMLSPSLLMVIVSVLLIAIGVWVLRVSWMKRPNRPWFFPVAGWALIMSGIAAYAHATTAEVGIAYGLLFLALAAYGAIVLSAQRRGRRQARAPLSLALEPEDRPTNWPRAIAKSLLSIALAGVAAIGVGVAFAVAMPLQTHDRVIIGGLLVPILWGGGMAWTLADAKLLRATIFLLIISAAGYAIAFAPKFLTWT